MRILATGRRWLEVRKVYAAWAVWAGPVGADSAGSL